MATFLGVGPSAYVDMMSRSSSAHSATAAAAREELDQIGTMRPSQLNVAKQQEEEQKRMLGKTKLLPGESPLEQWKYQATCSECMLAFASLCSRLRSHLRPHLRSHRRRCTGSVRATST